MRILALFMSLCWQNKLKVSRGSRFATEGRTRRKQKHLPRTNTELHGNKQKPRREEQEESRSICHGTKTLLSEPDA